MDNNRIVVAKWCSKWTRFLIVFPLPIVGFEATYMLNIFIGLCMTIITLILGCCLCYSCYEKFNWWRNFNCYGIFNWLCMNRHLLFFLFFYNFLCHLLLMMCHYYMLSHDLLCNISFFQLCKCNWLNIVEFSTDLHILIQIRHVKIVLKSRKRWLIHVPKFWICFQLPLIACFIYHKFIKQSLYVLLQQILN